MNLYEAQHILNENGYIVESLKANRRKFYVMIDKLLEPYGKDSYDYEEPNNRLGEDAIVLKATILRKIKKEALQEIVNKCGYQMSVHSTRNGNDIWITPINTEELDDDNFIIENGYRVLYHISYVNDLDKKGLRCKSRKKDSHFDVYEGRIYCMITEDSLEHARSMVTDEHDKHKSVLYTYKILVPKGYKIYPDPTTPDGVYLTNNVPPKFIKKIDDFDNDIEHYYENEKERLNDILNKSKKLDNINGIKV